MSEENVTISRHLMFIQGKHYCQAYGQFSAHSARSIHACLCLRRIRCVCNARLSPRASKCRQARTWSVAVYYRNAYCWWQNYCNWCHSQTTFVQFLLQRMLLLWYHYCFWYFAFAWIADIMLNRQLKSFLWCAGPLIIIQEAMTFLFLLASPALCVFSIFNHNDTSAATEQSTTAATTNQ